MKRKPRSIPRAAGYAVDVITIALIIMALALPYHAGVKALACVILFPVFAYRVTKWEEPRA